MDKKSLRKQIKTNISLMTKSQKDYSAEHLKNEVSSTLEWHNATTVLLYASLPDEIDTMSLINLAFEQKKIIVLPLVEGDNLRLLEYIPGNVSVGSFGILEPNLSSSREVELSEIDLAIIPGRAFTLDGKRLGRGKGFYDRMLGDISCPKWGVCFSCQKVESIETDPWDIPLDRVFFA